MILKVIKNFRDYVSLSANDVLLVSYPKSGNTWVRFLLCNYLEYIRGNYQQVNFEYLNKNMPEFGHNLHENQYFETHRRVVKTHKKYLPIFNKNASIYVIRHPKSVLKSFFHYNNNLKKNWYFENQSFSKFIDSKYGIYGYLEHYKSWKNHLELKVRYEDIQEKPFETLKQIVIFLQYPYSEEGILYAIQQSNDNQLKNSKVGHKEILKSNYNFIGNNAANSELKFSVADIALLEKAFAKYNFFDYDLFKD